MIRSIRKASHLSVALSPKARHGISEENMANFEARIAEAIIYLSKEKGYSWAKLGRLLGVDSETAARYAKKEGNFKAVVVDKLIKEENISPDWIFSGEGEMIRDEINGSQTDKGVSFMTPTPEATALRTLGMLEDSSARERDLIDQLRVKDAEIAELKTQLRLIEKALGKDTPPAGVEERREVWKELKKGSQK